MANITIRNIPDDVFEKIKALSGVWPFLLLFGLIIGGLYAKLFTPTEASVVAVVYSLVLGVMIYRSIKPRDLPRILYDSARFAAISLVFSA